MLTTKIKSMYSIFTKTEVKIADYFLAHFDLVLSKTLQELSKELSVGEASIIRFCKKVGYGSLHEIRFDIVRQLEKDKSSFLKTNDVIQSLFEEARAQIDNTYNLIDRRQIRRIVKKINDSSRIIFMGIGHSGIVAQLGSYRMLRYGKESTAISDIHLQSMIATYCGKNDLLIAVSLSGQSPELIESVKIAKANKTHIVSIVSHIESELAHISDETLHTTTEKIFVLPDGASIDGIMTQLLIIESLIQEYAQIDREATRLKSETITLSFAKNRKK